METKKTSNSIQQEYSDIIKDFNEYLVESKQYKNVWEIRSFVDESFYEWNHRVVFDTQAKQLTTLPVKSDTQFAIWKVRKIVRWVRNMITKNDPRWHPTSSRKQRITQKEIEVASALLQAVYKEDHMKDKIKDLLTHSLTKTLGWAFVWYDDRKKDVDIFIEDPFNIYTSPDGRLEWPNFVWKYMIRTIRKSLSDIKYNSIYNDSKFKEDLENIEADNRLAESEYKHSLLAQDYKIPVDENGSAIIQELYIMDSWEDEDAKEDKKEWMAKEIDDSTSPEEDQLQHNEWQRVRIITKVWDVIIRDELTEYENFPFIAYQPERNKGLLYSASWINPLTQLNKALDDWYSNRADWLEKFAKGRYMVQKGSRFSVIKGRNWQIVEYTGSKPTIMDTGNLPNEVNVHLNETERFMEDLWGLHSESTGRLNWWALSWVAIAQLQASDNNNVSEPVDNLKSFMEELAYRILYLWSKFYNLRQMDTESWAVNVIWSEVKQIVEWELGSKLWEDIIEIKPIKNIEVEIMPGSAFSDLQARQDLVELRWLWVAIPDKLIIDSYKLWNTEKIMNQYEDEQQAKQDSQDWVDWLESKQAELEDQKLVWWVNVVAQQGEKHEIHLAIHGALLKSMWQSQQTQLLVQHMQQHEAMLNPQGQQQDMVDNPQQTMWQNPVWWNQPQPQWNNPVWWIIWQ